jgi:hypothetical protein
MSKIYELHEISRDLWIVYEWIDVTEFGNTKRHFIRGKERTAEEGAKAAKDWDIWWEYAYNEYHKTPSENE